MRDVDVPAIGFCSGGLFQLFPIIPSDKRSNDDVIKRAVQVRTYINTATMPPTVLSHKDGFLLSVYPTRIPQVHRLLSVSFCCHELACQPFCALAPAVARILMKAYRNVATNHLFRGYRGASVLSCGCIIISSIKCAIVWHLPAMSRCTCFRHSSLPQL